MLVPALRDRTSLLAIWFVVLPALLFGTLGVLAPLRLDALGFTAVAIGTVWLVTARARAVINPLIGRVSDRTGRSHRCVPRSSSTIVARAAPVADERYVLAALIMLAGLAFGSF